MKKAIILILTILLSAITATAGDVSVEQALVKARQFAVNSTSKTARARRAEMENLNPQLAHIVKSKTTAGKNNVYIVNLGNDQGFVVVSGENSAEDDVLGYCDHGSFDYDNCPVQLKDLLHYYSIAIDSLRQDPVLAARARAGMQYPSSLGNIIVPPLLTTTWNQWAPYNNLCPVVTANGTDLGAMYGGHYATGCVPTAIAQVMNYWKWPKVTQGRLMNSFGDFTGEDFSGRTYDWDNMLDDYSGRYTEVQARAVAQLMADIGKVMATHYGQENGSPTTFMSLPLVRIFGYSPDIKEQSGATAVALTSTLKEELSQNRPVLYAGDPNDDSDGHALVCDGYTSNDYFHFNYGWGGVADGFYKLTQVRYINDCTIFTGVQPVEATFKQIGDFEYQLFKNGEAYLIDYKGAGLDDTGPAKENGDVVIPSTITDDDGTMYKVTRICIQAFYRKGHFTKIVLGDNIKAIDAYSFIYSTIDELVLSDKMEEVPDQAFQLTKIKKLTIGSSIKRIGKQAFAHCYLKEVICKTPAFEADDEAFFNCGYIDNGAWLDCITKVGRETFAMAKFETTPTFLNLVEVGSEAFASCTFKQEEFKVPPKLKSIEPDAFYGTRLSFFKVENNPNFLCSSLYQEFLCNSSGTSVIMTVNYRRFYWDIPETVIKLEPRSIRTGVTTIPATIVEMEGAYKDIENLSILSCEAVVPPEITDSAFNDKIFENENLRLFVPEGTKELYANAPGWRRFPTIIDQLEYTPVEPQGLLYRMVLNGTDDSGERVTMPVSEVAGISVSDDGKSVVIQRNGKSPITTSIDALGSITWKAGFVYENTEVFNLNENTLTAEASKCTVKFDPTVIDGDVQLSIRNSVLKPDVVEGVVSGQSFDLSLSDGRHELTGTVAISVPVNVRKDETVCAAYYNEDTGEWEPTYFEYDATTGVATITANHLSTYSIFEVQNANTKDLKLSLYEEAPVMYGLVEGTEFLLDIVSGVDPEWEMSFKAKENADLWKSIGLDVIYNIANGILEPTLGYKPFAEQVENAVEAMGYLGTALTILDVLRADIKGDDVAVASGTMKAILGHYQSVAASFIGTPIMAASMAGVAAIGICLDRFGTMVQERKVDLYRQAYSIYYSQEGKGVVAGTSKYGQNWYRSIKDWYNVFYALMQNPITADELNKNIETEVRNYCNRFWGDTDAQAMCVAEAKAQGLSSWFFPDEATRKTISDEYYAELMNGWLPAVITSVRNHMKVEAYNRYVKAAKSVAAMVNTQIGLRIWDKSWEEGKPSKYEGWQVRFAYIPSDVADKESWQCTLNEKGRAGIGLFTEYALIVNDMPTRVTLVNPMGKAVADYPFNITTKKGRQIFDIDISKGGIDVENPQLEGLELEYDPSEIASDWVCYGYDPYGEYGSLFEPGLPIRLNDPDKSSYKRTNFQNELEKFFSRHEFITADKEGHVKIGDDLTCQLEGNEATGKFSINTAYPFTEKTKDQFVKIFNNENEELFYRLDNLLNGTLKHKIEGEFKLTRNDDSTFSIEYAGSGTYEIEAEVVSRIDNFVTSAYNSHNGAERIVEAHNVKVADVTTRIVNANGNVKLKYKTKLMP